MKLIAFLLVLLLAQPAFSQSKKQRQKELKARKEAMQAVPDDRPDPSKNYTYDGTYIIDADEAPLLSGGQTDFILYLDKNMRYPESAIRDRKSGKVVLELVVDQAGRPQDVKVVQGIREDLDQEAVRLIQEMPDWIPGRKDGKPANVKVLITVKFPPLSPVEEERQLKRSPGSKSNG